MRVPAQTNWDKRTALGTRIKNARTALRLSVSELSQGLTSAAFLSRVEADERRPSGHLLDGLCARLHLDVDALTCHESPAVEGLRFELAHADRLLLAGQFRDAAQVGDDLAGIAREMGADDVATSAGLVTAHAIAQGGHPEAALGLVGPLMGDPAAVLSLAAVARFHLQLARFGEAIEVGRAASRLAVRDRISAPEAAGLAVVLCGAHRALDHHDAARLVARAALDRIDDDIVTGAHRVPDPVVPSTTAPYRGIKQLARQFDDAVAALLEAQLAEDVSRLMAFLPAGREHDAGLEPVDNLAVAR